MRSTPGRLASPACGGRTRWRASSASPANSSCCNRRIDRITIVRTRPEHVAPVNALVFASKGYWGYPTEMMELWRPALTMTAEDVRTRPAHHAEVGGEITGMYVITVGREAAELDALFVAPAHIGTGIGAALFDHAAAGAAAAGAAYLLVESDPHAVGFYERMGCRVVGERDSVPEGRVLPLLSLDLSPGDTAVTQ